MATTLNRSSRGRILLNHQVRNYVTMQIVSKIRTVAKMPLNYAMLRTGYLILLFAMANFASASANWFNRSEQYLAACGNEASSRFHKDISSEDGRRHIYLCMIAHGYAFKEACGKDGWVKPDCYRLKYKTEGR
jgi:hypothetical protein